VGNGDPRPRRKQDRPGTVLPELRPRLAGLWREWRPTVRFEEGQNIVKSFFGRSGSGVDQLGVYFEDAKPIKVLITKMDYDISAAQILDMNPEVVQTVLLKNDFLYNPYCFDADAVNSLC
jgi:hypothetical protein